MSDYKTFTDFMATYRKPEQIKVADRVTAVLSRLNEPLQVITGVVYQTYQDGTITILTNDDDKYYHVSRTHVRTTYRI